ncbi:Induced during hyphae development protein 1 [Heracleum sosnowskyi]|uniref:Induced during hyphae development protein 1 n=1 Tax=Heracleum sosnowskyi TaxID=360622 RepID=A0AAD8MUG4_9APIA|nr:Induced during hyphae development protein 1 [Heracleum sosnowskyi]
MNSNYGRSNKSSSFDFDLGLNSNNSKSLNDRKNKTSSTPSYSTPSYSAQSNKPSWTHQPAPPTQSVLPGSLSGPTSMVGDITGRSWANSAPAVKNGIGIVNKNPNLFGDLVGPALGNNKGGSNVPLKNLTPVASSGSKSGGFSMGGVADSLPKNGSGGGGGGWGFSGGNVGLSGGKSANFSGNVGLGGGKSANLGGPSMKSSVGSGMNSNKDPFGSLLNFGAKPATGMKTESKGTSNSKASKVDDGFGDFQKAPKPNVSASSNGASVNTSGGSYSKMDDFGFSATPNQPPVQPNVSASNDFDVLFSSPSVGGGASDLEDLGGQQSSGIDGWDTEFGGGNDMGGTTELEGLPPPPSGVTAAAAKNKGMENYKQGQFPDAIKWLSWAVVLFGKASDNNGINDVLSSRASCYKEVGEYKKAVADCTKVLEHDKKNVSVLVQRALLYESMEKYKLGAEDLRTVMKLDPGNRVARSTVHRLTKMAEG